MPNRKKKNSERKSEVMSIRMSPKMKKQLWERAQIENKSPGELVSGMLEEYLNDSGYKNRNIYRLVRKCCEILEENEKVQRRQRDGKN